LVEGTVLTFVFKFRLSETPTSLTYTLLILLNRIIDEINDSIISIFKLISKLYILSVKERKSHPGNNNKIVRAMQALSIILTLSTKSFVAKVGLDTDNTNALVWVPVSDMRWCSTKH